jgi:hypothetical protein
VLDAGEGHRAGALGQLDRLARLEVDAEHRAVGLPQPLEVRLVELVDRLRDPGVEAEVTDVGEHRDGRVAVVAHHVDRVAVDQRVRRVEQPLEPDVLAGLAPGRLDHAERLEVRALGKEHGGPVVDDVALRVAHDDHRRVAVPDQEHLGAADRERVVDPEVVALGGRPGRGLVGQRGPEGAGHALPGPVLDPLDVEVVHREVERLHLVGVEQRAGREVVVLGEGVGEAVADHQDHAALVAEQAADAEADQHHQHREVEQQVPRLAELAALGRDPATVLARGGGDPMAAGEVPAGALEHERRLLVGGVRRMVGQAAQVAGGGRWRLPVAAPVDEQPRHDAADQRHHEEQVDRREPR